MSEKCKRVVSRLLSQDCYVRYKEPVLDARRDYSQTDYVTQDEVVEVDGIKVVRRVEPYPITPEYVNSFASACDYKSDPLNNLGVSRLGLGDITALQDAHDVEGLVALRDRITSALSALNTSQQPEKAVEKTVAETEVKNVE